MSQRFKNIIFFAIILWVAYIVIGAIIENMLLKKYGKCGVAVMTHELVYSRYHKCTLYYDFTYGNKTYQGNSLEEDLDKAGDSICVVCLESFPSVNRPVKYFDEGKIKCSCNKYGVG